MALFLWGYEFQLQRLAAKTHRHGKQIGFHRLMAHIHIPVIDTFHKTGKEHALEAPIREIKQLLIFRCLVREKIAENTLRHEIGFYTTEITGKKTIRFLKNCRCPALGALMFNE